MTYTLPSQAEANSETGANIADAVTTAQNAFIASTTVLINNAIANGLFFVEPIAIPLVSSSFVTTYFENLGYTVLFPLIPTYPYNPSFVAGFPEVLPPGYRAPLSNPDASGPPRFKISWGAPVPPPLAESFLWLESGDLLLLEDGIDGILLE